MTPQDPAERDHLFISYAVEDAAVADWLVRKLTAHGYRVWCDRFKLLGGERWPSDIDKAIKTRTFRMIALLSRFSIEKDNPSKERQLALTISKDRRQNFLIPLNIDSLRPGDLGWELSDINWIPFDNWAVGFGRLTELLDKLGAPKVLGTDGPAATIASFQPAVSVLDARPEPVISNCFPLTARPAHLLVLRSERKVHRVEQIELARSWPFYRIDDHQFLSFVPPENDADLRWSQADVVPWSDEGTILGISARHVTTSILRKALTAKCVALGMALEENGSTAYFPEGLLHKNKISYSRLDGRRSSVSVLGERRFGKGRLRYHLGVAFWMRHDIPPGTAMQMKVRVHVTDPSAANLDGKGINARRKKVTKSWWNHEWFSRQLAIASFLAQGTDVIALGAGAQRVGFASVPLGADVAPSINDALLTSLRERVRAMNASLGSLDDETVELASPANA